MPADPPVVSTESLLEPGEAPAFEVIDGALDCPYFITCDHAGRTLPRRLGSLGLSEHELAAHIAWDIGAANVTRHLARGLGAFAILQTYSRLVIDCNRPLDAESSIVRCSERTQVPGNLRVTPAQAEQRARAIFHPYHARIHDELEARSARGQQTILIAMHSFTPRFLGEARPWHVGVLSQRDRRLADALLALLRREEGEGRQQRLVVGDNQPYAVSDLTDYGIVQYGERRGLLHVELELRQDLIAEAPGAAAWAERLAAWLERARSSLDSAQIR